MPKCNFSKVNTVTNHLKGENDELVERPVTPGKGNSQKKSREVKKKVNKF